VTRITLEQRIAASPAAVYAYLTDAEKWRSWQGERAEITAEPGGIFSMVMGNGMNARGQFVSLEPDRLVSFTWGWVDQPGIPPGSTLVEIELESIEEGTLVRLTHSSVSPDEAPMQEMGWRHYLPRLAIAASGRDPGPDPGPG
jgi:uncharacterized protein YndB with AHSA1/START domain